MPFCFFLITYLHFPYGWIVFYLAEVCRKVWQLLIQCFDYWTFEYCNSEFVFEYYICSTVPYFWPTELVYFNVELLSIIIVHKVCNRLFAGETEKNNNLLYFFALWNSFDQNAIVMYIFFFNFLLLIIRN